MLVELLRGQGYQVTEADSADEALERMQHDRPDLILIDFNLPPQGGRWFLEQVAALGKTPPRAVALAQGFHDEQEVDRLRSLGVAACVARSAPIDDILVAVRTALFPEAKDLRRSPRAQVHIPVCYRAEDEQGELNPDVATHTFNLSADGMFIVTTAIAPSAPGTKVEVRFWLPAAAEIMVTEGVVIWCNQAGSRMNELYPPGMGVMFLGLKREAAGVINEYVRERTVNPFR